MAEPLLKKGATGEPVRELQEALSDLGFYDGPVDGKFGDQTESAVKHLQHDFGLQVDGIVGPATWRIIDEADQTKPVVKKGSRGAAVRRVQSRLTAAGFDTGGVDGVFGDRTESAVKAFQSQQGLAADGIVGPTTWAKIDAIGD